jgi:O-antigen/teichoic acid export membrane protein
VSLRKTVLSGVVWTFTQQFSTQGISFIVSLVLARILTPAEFGLIGMISVFVAIGSSLMESGMTQSLIRTANPTIEDYSTVFYFNMFMSLLVYLIVFFGAPYIGLFFKQPILKNLVRIYSLSFIITATYAVQQAMLTKNMDFKTQMIIAVPSLLISGILGIVLAYSGFGVWSLAYMSLCQALLISIQHWWHTKWRPSFSFSKEKFSLHFHFGYKLLFSGLLDTLFNNSYQIIIGRFFSPAQVGFYTRADQLKQLPVTNISSTLNKVTYPLFASIQNEDVRLKKVYKQVMQMVVYIIAPTLVFMGILAEPIFRLLFTDKWLPAVPYFQILCLTGILYPIHSYNLNILKVKGRSDLYLKLEIYKKIIIAVSLIIAIPMGIVALLWSQVVMSVLAFFINTYYSGKLLKYSAWQQIKDIVPSILLATLVGALVFFFDRFLEENHISDILRISFSLPFGFFAYIVASRLAKYDSFFHIQQIALRK